MAESVPEDPRQAAHDLLHFGGRLIRGKSILLRELREWWVRCRSGQLDNFPALYVCLAEEAGKGDPFLCFDIAETGLRASTMLTPEDRRRLLQFKALSLARIGAPEAAAETLDAAMELDPKDAETLGIRARLFKDIWAAGPPGSAQAMLALRRARDLYREAFESVTPSGHPTKWSFAGINAAATSLLLGEQRYAGRVAKAVGDHTSAWLEANPDARQMDRYWATATVAEAHLIQGELEEAERAFAAAAPLARDAPVAVSSTRQQASRLLSALGLDPATLDAHFPVPNVVVFTGHRFDAPGRRPPRFPREQEDEARRMIRTELDRIDARIGYCSAADGSDLLFLEEMHKRGAETHVQLPFPKEIFLRFTYAGADESLRQRLDQVLAAATSFRVTGMQVDFDEPVVYAYSNQVLLGRARMKADSLRADVRLLAFWNGEPGLPGGAGSMARWADERKFKVTRLDPVHGPSPMPGPEALAAPEAAAPAPPESSEEPPEIRALLFADVVKYSLLTDKDARLFVKHYMGAVSRLMKDFSPPPLAGNTWGDAFKFVFADVEQAGRFALALREVFDRLENEPLDLSRNPRMRIALHAGPVLPVDNPVIAQRDFTGTHVNRAARIEPITTEHQIFASQEFAALAALQPGSRLCFTYVGERELPKQDGTIALYLLRERPC